MGKQKRQQKYAVKLNVACIFMTLDPRSLNISPTNKYKYLNPGQPLPRTTTTLIRSPPLSILADCIQLRPEIKAWTCFQKVDYTFGHNPKQRLVFNFHYGSGTHGRHYGPETHLRGNPYISFPHCFKTVIIYYQYNQQCWPSSWGTSEVRLRLFLLHVFCLPPCSEMLVDVDMVGSLHRERKETVCERVIFPKFLIKVPSPDKSLENWIYDWIDVEILASTRPFLLVLYIN